MNPRRLGKFSISLELLETVDYKYINAIFKGMRIFEAAYHYDTTCIVYTAECEEFDLVERGCIAPMYQVTFYIEGNGEVKREIAQETSRKGRR